MRLASESGTESTMRRLQHPDSQHSEERTTNSPEV